MIKNLTCIGAGYVGGPTMAVIADRCPHIRVTVVDSNPDRIAAWNSDTLPVYEPGLDAVVKRARGRNLFFSSDIEPAIAAADCVFISVNTPTKTEGEGAGKASDLRFVESCTRLIAKAARDHTLVVEKSTLPVRSAERVREILDGAGSGKTFDVLSNPEFLAEGTAIADLENPDRVLIGGDPAPAQLLAEVYANWVPRERILTTKVWSAEMAKLAANAFLAQRISSINALSAFCEATGADIDEVARAIGTDSRIGAKFLKAGVGFGGSCFKKDILNLVYLCEHHGLPEVAAYWQQVVDLNEWQKRRVAATVIRSLGGSVNGRRLAILGFAFKKDTNDTREAPAIAVCSELLENRAEIAVFDPQVPATKVRQALSEVRNADKNLFHADSVYEAARHADAVIVLTDWDDFRKLDWKLIASNMQKPAWVFDARNCCDHNSIRAAALSLWAVGKPNYI